MRNSKGVSLIALIITIIVIIILAAIVMQSSTSTIGNAQYAQFSQEFGDFSQQVQLDAANIKQQTGIRAQNINDAQMFYMTANGLTNAITSGEGVAGWTVPMGYVLTNNDTNDKTYPYVLQKILNVGSPSGDKNDGSARGTVDQFVAYVIRDNKISNYTTSSDNKANGASGKDFYGDSNGEEYHFVTSNGQVFTLPGYPQTQTDGTIQYHIDTLSGHYYVVKGNSTIEVGHPNVNGDIVTNTKPILATYLTSVHGVTSNNESKSGDMNASILTTNHTKIVSGS